MNKQFPAAFGKDIVDVICQSPLVVPAMLPLVTLSTRAQFVALNAELFVRHGQVGAVFPFLQIGRVKVLFCLVLLCMFEKQRTISAFFSVIDYQAFELGLCPGSADRLAVLLF